eukprot:TCONS_00028992-protein
MSMQLPCRHIFKSRSLKGCTPIFASFVGQEHIFIKVSGFFWNRTLKERKRSKFRRPMAVMNQVERCRSANGVCQNLSKLASEAGGSAFVERMRLLQKLEDLWRDGKEARLIFPPDRVESEVHLRNETSTGPDLPDRVESEVHPRNETSTGADPQFKHENTIDVRHLKMPSRIKPKGQKATPRQLSEKIENERMIPKVKLTAPPKSRKFNLRAQTIKEKC